MRLFVVVSHKINLNRLVEQLLMNLTTNQNTAVTLIISNKLTITKSHMQYKILHSILKSCVDICCFFFFFPCRVNRAKDDINHNKNRGRKQYLYHALSSIKTEYFPVIPFWSHCFGIWVWTTGSKKLKTS